MHQLNKLRYAVPTRPIIDRDLLFVARTSIDKGRYWRELQKSSP